MPSRWSGDEFWGQLACWRPRLARRVLLRRDDVYGRDMVLLAEGVLRLGPTATAVVRLCDGGHTVEEIVAELEATSHGAGVEAEVTGLLGHLAEQGVFQ
jgi:pyrroloquinoline quinone biosynthesis protein D